MRREELNRRSAELKARMLAQRNESGQERPSTFTERRSRAKEREGRESFTGQSGEGEDVSALSKRIAELEAENSSLQQQIATMSSRAMEPSRSSGDSVWNGRREQISFRDV
jgi:hypothetical protein